MVASAIDIYRNTLDGSTVLVSRKNIHLPSGMLIVLQNVDPPETTAKK